MLPVDDEPELESLEVVVPLEPDDPESVLELFEVVEPLPLPLAFVVVVDELEVLELFAVELLEELEEVPVVAELDALDDEVPVSLEVEPLELDELWLEVDEVPVVWLDVVPVAPVLPVELELALEVVAFPEQAAKPKNSKPAPRVEERVSVMRRAR